MGVFGESMDSTGQLLLPLTSVEGGAAPLLENDGVAGPESSRSVEDDELVDFRNAGNDANLMRNAWESMTVEWDVWLLLLSVGFLTSAICFSVDAAIEELIELRYWLMDITPYTPYRMGIWMAVGIFLLTFAWSFTQLVSVDAIGSGIPRMKAVLSGADPKGSLSFQCLAAKVIGLTCALGSGLPIGKEGPFVHIGTCIASLLTKIPAFSRIARHESLMTAALSAGVAVGVSATFGAPIGGVLFAIEVTRIYFLVSSYWVSFFACCCGAFFYQIGKAWTSFEHMLSKTALLRTDFGIDSTYHNYEIILFIMVGVIMGFLAALWVTWHAKFVRFWRGKVSRTSYHGMLRDFCLMIVVGITVGAISFPQLIGDIDSILVKSKLPMFPVIESAENPVIIGSVERQLLGEFVTEYKLKGSFGGSVTLPEIELRRREATSPRGESHLLSKSFDPETHELNMMLEVTVPASSGLADAGQVIGRVPFDSGHHILEATTLPDIVNQFIMLNLTSCLVTRGGRAIGIITRKMLIEAKY